MKFPWNGKEWYIDGYLAETLKSLIYNIKNDWDFVILITGDRGVRVGKSVLAITICAYLAYLLQEMKINKNAYGINNIFFDNKVMVEDAQKMPQYSIVHYDEGREGLAATKSMKSFQQDLMDFFAECGQLNHCFVIVCPDFFELKETIAVARSECLINVYRKEVPINTKYGDVVRFDRGFMEFFNKTRKRTLYDLARSTRKKVYNLVKPNFFGRFTNQYCVEEEAYKKKKADSLARFAQRHKDQLETEKDHTFRNIAIYEKHKQGYGWEAIQEWLETTRHVLNRAQIFRIIREHKLREIKGSEQAPQEPPKGAPRLVSSNRTLHTNKLVDNGNNDVIKL